jgi:monofunctional biosynthetic peptidoglycan transglycosylase
MVKALAVAILAVPVLIGSFILYIYLQIPSSKDIRSCFTTTMNQVYLCQTSKNYVSLKQIAPVMRQAILLSEDSAFYQHNGFDWESMEKSAIENLKKGTYKRGGSTITQQLAKNLFLHKEKTLLRKFIEGLITVKLERTLAKNDILEKYLNVIEFGKGIYGIKPAAEYYFKKSPANLTAAESAFLTMLLPNPVKYSTSFQKKELTRFAETRVRRIVSDLYKYSRIDEATYNAAVEQIPALFGAHQVELINFTSEEPSENAPTIEEATAAESQEDLTQQAPADANNSNVHANPTHDEQNEDVDSEQLGKSFSK